jgi:hypothetical protein
MGAAEASACCACLGAGQLAGGSYGEGVQLTTGVCRQHGDRLLAHIQAPDIERALRPLHVPAAAAAAAACEKGRGYAVGAVGCAPHTMVHSLPDQAYLLYSRLAIASAASSSCAEMAAGPPSSRHSPCSPMALPPAKATKGAHRRARQGQRRQSNLWHSHSSGEAELTKEKQDDCC